MSTNYEIEFNKETGIKKIILTGKITKDRYISILKSEYEKDATQKTSLMVEDCRTAKFQFHPSEIQEIKDIIINNSIGKDFVKIASIANDPLTTALYKLIAENHTTPNLEQEVFSTEEYAINWLKD